jgi:hypothetical protein
VEEKKLKQNAKQASFAATLTEDGVSKVKALEKSKKEAAEPIYLNRY